MLGRNAKLKQHVETLQLNLLTVRSPGIEWLKPGFRPQWWNPFSMFFLHLRSLLDSQLASDTHIDVVRCSDLSGKVHQLCLLNRMTTTPLDPPIAPTLSVLERHPKQTLHRQNRLTFSLYAHSTKPASSYPTNTSASAASEVPWALGGARHPKPRTHEKPSTHAKF